MHSLKKTQNIIFILLVGFYFAYAARALINEARLCFASYKQMRSFSPDQKRHALLGDIVVFADICKKIIPENDRALLLINLPSRPNNDDFQLNYYLYPRKLYWLHRENAYPNDLPALSRNDYCALQQQDIRWIIYMYSAPFTMQKIVRLEKCGIAATYTIDMKKGQYVRDR
jgi:hypothetical protein